MKTIQLNKDGLDDLMYEFTSSDAFGDGEDMSEDFQKLLSKATEAARIRYKQKYEEEPEEPYDPEFSGLTAMFLSPILQKAYDAFYIDENTAEGDPDTVLAASFYATRNGEKHVLIEDISGKMFY